MPSVLAIVSKAVFAKEAGRLGVGDVFPTELYRSKNRGLSPLAEGGNLYLATVRPGDVLWLVAVLEAPSETDDGWRSGANTRPIADISGVMPELRFSTGKGITATPGKLGMSLQTPRTLTDGDVQLLAGAAAKKAPKPAAKKPVKPAAKKAPTPAAKKKAAAPKPAAKKTKVAAPKAAAKKVAAKPAAKKPAAKKPAAKRAKVAAEAAANKASGAAPVSDDLEPTIRSLLSSWRATKSADLAELIDAFSRAYESAAAREVRERHKIPQDEWLGLAGLAAGLGVVDRGAVLASMAKATAAQVTTRLELLEKWEPDPRVVDALHELIRKLPWTSTGSRTVWTRTFRILATIGDPRTVEVAEAFNPASIASSWAGPGQWMGERLTKLAKTVRGLPDPAPTTAELQEMIESVRSGLPRETSSEGEVSAAAQLEYVLRHPDDDTARLVLADALQEIGDPRGELIALQYLGESSKLSAEQRQREKQILTEHFDDLLGPMAPIVMKRGLVFERGFLRSCELKENVHATQLEEAGESGLLGTIHAVRGPLDFMLLKNLRSLRHVTITGWGQQPLERLLLHPEPLPFEALALRLYKEQIGLLDRCTCLPALKKLSLHGRDEVIVEAAATKLAKNVEWLNMCDFAPEAFGGHAERVLRSRSRVSTVSLEHGEISPSDWRCELRVSQTTTPKAPELSVSVDLLLPRPSWQGSVTRCLRNLGATLDSLRQLPIQSVTVTSRKKIDEKTRSRLLQTLRSNMTNPDALVINEP